MSNRQNESEVGKRVYIPKICSSTVTSTSQHQIFDEKFDQEPKNVRIKMADLAGP